ncbi:hypothetical protein M758_9G145900, partial [Ceratodon purpureus]
MAARVIQREAVDLSRLSYADAVDFLRENATVLDYKTLTKKEKDILNAASPGIVPGLYVKNKKNVQESVILCTT